MDNITLFKKKIIKHANVKIQFNVSKSINNNIYGKRNIIMNLRHSYLKTLSCRT